MHEATHRPKYGVITWLLLYELHVLVLDLFVHRYCERTVPVTAVREPHLHVHVLITGRSHTIQHRRYQCVPEMTGVCFYRS